MTSPYFTVSKVHYYQLMNFLSINNHKKKNHDEIINLDLSPN